MAVARLKSLLFTVGRMVVGVGIAVYLIHRTLGKAEIQFVDLWRALAGASLPWLAIAVLLHGGVLLLASARWFLLLRAQQVPIRWPGVLRLSLIGFFFNLAVPGAVGGDLAKVGYLARQRSGRATEAVFSIVVDRLIGIFGLFLVAAVCTLISLPKLMALGPEFEFIRLATFIVGLGSVAGVLGLVALEFHRQLLNLPGLRRLWPILARCTPQRLRDTVLRLVAAVDGYRRQRGTIGVAILISLAVHCLLAFNLFSVGQALHNHDLPLRDYFLTTQVSNAIASLPITPGGVGLRDRSNQEFLEAFGLDRQAGALIPITMTLVILFWALIGMIVFILSPAARNTPVELDNLPPTLPLEPCE